MAGFQIDMSPLERSSRTIGQSLMNIGQTVGNTIQSSNQQEQQQQEQGDAEDLMRRALGGDPEAFKELTVKSPQAARQAAEYIQSQQAGQQGETDKLNAEKLKANQETVKKLYRIQSLPEEQRAIEYQNIIADPLDDFDETDLPYMSDPKNLQAAGVEYFGADAAKAMFDGQQDKTKFQQGSGKMAGHVFNPDDGTFSINPEIKNKIDAAKEKPVLGFKDIQGLNKDFTSLTQDTKLIRNTAKDLSKLSKMVGTDGNVSGPSSIAMVFKFMKALDPTSVVRESEFATAENSSGVPENMRNLYNKLMSGGKLGPKQVDEFVSTAKGLANSAIDSSSTEIENYLNTFGNTIPANTRDSLLKRIPERFENDKKESNTEVTQEQYNLMPSGTKYTINGVDYVKGE